ncbi:MAG: sugar ABC transporter substrate-binding protein [Candidatus Hydrogenedentota bacterium]|nr:MAG: sugar ABC transporter substrate-binding protein [Candidatus Hydrogenedentota bacterium]
MKQFVLFFTSLLILFSCSPTKKVTHKEIVVWESYNNKEHTVFMEIVSRFEAENPEIKIKVERVPFDGLLSKIITASIANRTPDIARIDIGHLPRLAYGKVALNLSSYGAEQFIKTNLLPVLLESNRVYVQGKAGIYGISDQLTNLALFYNKKLFRQKGILAPPKTWDEFILTAKKLTNRKAGLYGFSMNASLWWILPILYSYGADVLQDNNTKCALQSKEAIAAFTFIQDMYQKYKVESGAWRSGAINPDQAFVNSKTAMVFSGPWNLGNYSAIDYGVSLLPATPPIRSATNVGGTTMIVFAGSQYKKESYQFLTYVASKASQKLWIQKLQQVSVNKIANKEMHHLFSPVMKVFVKQAEYAHARPMIPNYDRLEQTVNPLLYTLLEGKISPEQMAKKACNEIQKKVLSELQ